MVAPATMAQAAVAYRLGGRDIPDALRHNVLLEWQMLRAIALPDGEWLYPQGLDWDLHDYEHLHYWTMLATLFHDPNAALLERRTIGYARRRQEINGDGSFVGPSGGLGFAREAVQAERVAFALLMHEQFGAAPASPSAADFAAWSQAEPAARVFEGAGFAVYRAKGGVFSFSWRNRLMGLVAPAPDAAFDSPTDAPYVTTPNAESLTGRFRLLGQSERDGGKWTVRAHAVSAIDDGLVAVVDAEVNNGKLRQQIAAVAVAPGVLAYLDRVTSHENVTVIEERGLPVAIENDDVSGNRRRIDTAGAAPLEVIAGKAGDHRLTGSWANVDGRLGVAVASVDEAAANSGVGPALCYRAAGKPNRSGAREDFLFGRLIDAVTTPGAARTFKAGEVVAERALLLLPNATPETTARVAASLRVTRPAGGGGTLLHFVDAEGKPHDLRLDGEGRAAWQGKLWTPAVEAASPKGAKGSALRCAWTGCAISEAGCGAGVGIEKRRSCAWTGTR